MVITLVGAGRVATHLGLALAKAGHEVGQVWNRTETSGAALASMLGCPHAHTAEALDRDADVIIISVKDSALDDVARMVGDTRALVLHTAGSMTLDSLPQERTGVIYPMQTFSRERSVDFRCIPLFIETRREEDLPVLQTLAQSLSDSVTVMDSPKRQYLHVAAVFACNFVNHLYDLSADVLERQGIPFDILLPLIDETALKVHSLHPHKAQTGPALRWDRNVIAKHQTLLTPEENEVYRLLSESIHRKHHD